MISIFRLFGGIAFLLMGIAYWRPLPHPLPLAVGIFLIIAAIALLAGY